MELCTLAILFKLLHNPTQHELKVTNCWLDNVLNDFLLENLWFHRLQQVVGAEEAKQPQTITLSSPPLIVGMMFFFCNVEFCRSKKHKQDILTFVFCFVSRDAYLPFLFLIVE
ncbi:hypothetical protein ATANTOWER_019460 [Ataeniobius toweri]|uniref:Uncharacterized protein n=1 Tax=Ataeniobius toweri TaxID=208326 RepID=A0ABU7AGI4_9TELE|nr:hypothetical protein [Ataeniobius toweri]